jgi:hypothetical protein
MRRAATRARALLNKTKTLEQWLATADEDRIAMVRKLFGDPEAFYKKFISALADIASGRKRSV